MTPVEAVILIKYIGEGCPSMRMGEATPDVWYDAGLSEIPFDAAKQAAVNIMQRERYIGLNDLLEESALIARQHEGHIRALENEARDLADGVRAIEAQPPGTPGEDWEALRETLRARAGGAEFKRPGTPRRRFIPDPDRLAKAKAELDGMRGTG